jgi:hypothetical protein
MIKKIFVALGALIAVGVIVVGILVFVASRKSSEITAEVTPYVDDAVVAITSSWNPNELVQRFTPELHESAKFEDVEALFSAADAALGPLVTYHGAEMQTWKSSASVGGGSQTMVVYLAQARFERGDASFTITLIRLHERWMIHGFQINSSALLRGIAGSKT